MTSLRKTILATRILLLAGAGLTTPAAAASFDGAWNVQIASTNSACGSGTNVSIGISNGQVASNNAMMTASGRVADAGSIHVDTHQRDEARGRFGSPYNHVRIRYLARRALLGHLDRAANLTVGARDAGRVRFPILVEYFHVGPRLHPGRLSRGYFFGAA